jgi:methylglyoxal synthase
MVPEKLTITTSIKRSMLAVKRIALVAHDNKKQAMLDWAAFNRELLGQHALCATGNTGHLLKDKLGLGVTTFRSSPLGSDQQIGAKIVDRASDVLIFFWDPLEPNPTTRM